MKRVVVTGANKGIGLATVEVLAERGFFVFLGSRSLERGEAAWQTLPDEARAAVEVLQIDVTDNTSVAAAVATVRSRCPDDPQPLHGLVNNAGGASALQYTTHRDLVAVLELNYRSVRRVSEAFAPLLAVGGRVAMVGSNMGPRFVQQCSEERRRFFSNPKVTADQLERLLAEIVAVSEVAAGESRREGGTKCAEVESRAETVNVDTDAGEAEQGNLRAAAGFARLGLGSCGPYGLAKASVAVYASHLARAHPDLRINTCHPGQIETDLTRSFAHKFGLELAAMGLRTPREGATCVVHLIAEELEAPRGEAWFYGSDLQRSPLHRDRATSEPPYDGTLAEV